MTGKTQLDLKFSVGLNLTSRSDTWHSYTSHNLKIWIIEGAEKLDFVRLQLKYSSENKNGSMTVSPTIQELKAGFSNQREHNDVCDFLGYYSTNATKKVTFTMTFELVV